MTTSTAPFVTWLFIWLFTLCKPTTDTNYDCGTIWGLMIGQVYLVMCLWFSIKIPTGVLGEVAFSGWDVFIVVGLVAVTMMFIVLVTMACFDLAVVETSRWYLTIMLLLMSGFTVLYCYIWTPIYCHKMNTDFPKAGQCFFFI